MTQGQIQAIADGSFDEVISQFIDCNKDIYHFEGQLYNKKTDLVEEIGLN